MQFFVRMLSGESESNPSSKRTITFLAFLLLAVAFFAELFFERKVSPQTFDAITYIVLGGWDLQQQKNLLKRIIQNEKITSSSFIGVNATGICS